MSGIGDLLGGYGVQLEQKALGTFGAAVGDYGRQGGLGALADIAQSSINNKGLTVKTLGGLASAFGVQGIEGLMGTGSWQSTRYAADLVQYAPKHRFIFKVKFIFNDPYSSKINREFMFLVKEIDKPTVHWEYEDVNMYNFKTQVLKSIRHEPLNMSFHDDIQNKVLDFFNEYRKAHSPISNLDWSQAKAFESTGMDFYQPGAGGVNSASMGVLAGNSPNMLSHIEVTQVYAHGTRQNVFHFVNPRILSFDFDNLSMESSEGNSLAVSFSYDGLYIFDAPSSGTPSPAWGQTDILGNKEGGTPQQFGNQTMGDGNIGGKLGGGIGNMMKGATDALGQPISAITSAFGNIKAGFNGIVSSATSEINSLTDKAMETLGGAALSGAASLSKMFKGTKEMASSSADFSQMDAQIDPAAAETDSSEFAQMDAQVDGNPSVADYSNDAANAPPNLTSDNASEAQSANLSGDDLA